MPNPRRSRRKVSLAPLIATSVCGLAIGLTAIAAVDGDPTALFRTRHLEPALATLAPMPVPQSRRPIPQSGAISEAQMLYLVRSSLLMLNDANRTGNYSILHERAGPSFRHRNMPGDLVRIFAGVKRSGIDLSGIALQTPALDAPPFIGPDRRLRIKGAFAVAGKRVMFDLSYEIADREWRLFGISIGMRPAEVAAEVAAR